MKVECSTLSWTCLVLSFRRAEKRSWVVSGAAIVMVSPKVALG